MSRSKISDLFSLREGLRYRYTPSNDDLKARDRRSKKIPKSVGARRQPCSKPLLMRKGSDQDASYMTVPFMPSWKETTKLRSLGGGGG